MIPIVKVCCIESVEEAHLAVKHGARVLGLVSAMPSGPGPISEERIAEIAAAAPAHVETFLLTSLVHVDAIAAQHDRCRTTAIQIVDRLERGTHADLKRSLPGVKVVQVIHVTGEVSVEEAREAGETADVVLLDSGNPTLKVKELGGTGRRHDWSLSRRVVEASRAPVFLAGGLKPENVAEAVTTVRPYGLDVCSGLREEGRLSDRKLAAFFAALPR